MLKKKLISYTLAFIVACPMLAAKAIIYDLNGVLADIHSLGVAQEIGFFDTLFYYFFDTRSLHDLEDRLFNTLEAMDGTQDAPSGCAVCNGHLRPLPKLMCRWMDGSMDCRAERSVMMAQLKRLYCAGFFKNSREYRIMKNLIICMFFEPHRLNRHKKPIKKMLSIAREIKAAGIHRQFLLSNMDALGFADFLTTKTGRAITQVIERKDMIISADIGYNKPHPQAYMHLITLHKLDPAECIFIDDQYENVLGARAVGMIGLHVTGKNYKEIRAQLIALGVL